MSKSVLTASIDAAPELRRAVLGGWPGSRYRVESHSKDVIVVRITKEYTNTRLQLIRPARIRDELQIVVLATGRVCASLQVPSGDLEVVVTVPSRLLSKFQVDLRREPVPLPARLSAQAVAAHLQQGSRRR